MNVNEYANEFIFIIHVHIRCNFLRGLKWCTIHLCIIKSKGDSTHLNCLRYICHFASAFAWNMQMTVNINIQDAAMTIDAKILNFNNVDMNGKGEDGEVINDLPPYPGLMQTIFDANINEPSELISTIGNTIYAIQVEEVIPQRTMSFNEAKDIIIKDIQKIESQNLALNTAEEIIVKINNNQDIETLTNEYNLIVLEANNVKKDGSGSEGILNEEALSAIFDIKKGQITNAIKYNNTYIIAKVEDISPVNKINNEDLLKINLSVSQSIAKDIQDLFINNITKEQKINVNEKLLDSLFQNNS